MKHYAAATFKGRDSIGYLLRRSHGLLMDRAESAFADHDISFTQWIMLLRVRDGMGATATDLCRSVGHDSGALTRLLDQLEQRGYIERTRSKKDRRVVELSLTRAGRVLLESLIPIAVDSLNAALADFSVTEFSELKRLLGKLIATLDGAPRPAAVKPMRKRK